VVLFRTIMDNALGKYIFDACQHGYSMRKGLTARVLGYLNETELNGVGGAPSPNTQCVGINGNRAL
jgi:hypothetical protein